MDRKKLIKNLAILIFFVFSVNFLANKFYWYSAIWYFDMIMHFLGGFSVGLLSFWFFSLFDENLQAHLASGATNIRLILEVVIFIFFIGVSWEVFEFVFNNMVAQNSFNLLDTISDIFFDLSGGVSAILYFSKRIMLQSKYEKNS